jgi:uncharacterized repeat protein (TIGR01451 family)
MAEMKRRFAMQGIPRSLRIASIVVVILGGASNSRGIDFAPPKTYPVGASPSAIVVGDFNGDGKPDLAVGNSGSNNVSILLGNGDGTFQPAANFDAGISPSSIAVGDFNGDGKLDLAVFMRGNPTNGVAGVVSILLGNGDGTFQAAKSLPLTALTFQIAVADFNSDKNADLAVSNVDPGTKDVTMSIFLGEGDGTFQSAKTFSMPAGAIGAFAVADFNNDTKPDFAIGGSGGMPIFLSKGDGTFQLGPAAPTVEGFEVDSVQAKDVNGDGKVDLIISSFHRIQYSEDSETTQHVSIFLGNGDGTFQEEHVIASAGYEEAFGHVIGSSITGVAVGDFNGDGKVDVAYRRNSSLEIVLGRGDGTFSSAVIMDDIGAILVASDLNADNLSDLVTIGTSNSVEVLLNSGPSSGADLGIVQSGASPEPVSVGSYLTYTAHVLNEGPQRATGVKFTDTLPNAVNFVSASATQGTCIQSNGIVSCNIGSLLSAFDSTVNIIVTPTAAGTITNSMSVAAIESDLALANNSATQITTVNPVFTLSVTKSGTGSGTIQSDSSIDCGTSCSTTLLSGTVVSLSAIPSAGSTFSNWSGACTGTDPNVCSVTLNSDQSVTAAFNTAPDFSLIPAATSLTMKRGGQVSEMLTFPAQGGFSGSIALACAVTGPAPMPTCGISPTSVTPGNSATLTVNTAALSASLTAPWIEQEARLSAAWLPLGLLGCVLVTGFDKKRRRLWALCLLMLVSTILPTACGGGNSVPPPPVAQSYTVTVTATSGTIQHSTTVSVTVN